MAGTQKGGRNAAATNKANYGSDFYRRIGAIGGTLSRGGGFTTETARKWGKIGGKISRRPTKQKLDSK